MLVAVFGIKQNIVCGTYACSTFATMNQCGTANDIASSANSPNISLYLLVRYLCKDNVKMLYNFLCNYIL